MDKVTISQNPALYIEIARREGVSGPELLELLKRGDLSRFRGREDEHFHFSELAQYEREYPEKIRRALTEGYEISFNTMGGIRTLLKLMFDLETGRDYVQEADGLTSVPLTADQRGLFRSILSRYWVLEPEEPFGGNPERYRIRQRRPD